MDARFPGWTHDESLLAETLLDDPWADPELPSYVALDGEELIGFIGVLVRRMRLDERTLRGVVSSHLVVSADPRAGFAGALLLRHVLSGPQDLTWTDSATDRVLRLWRSLGGHMDYARSYDWMLVLRPLRWIAAVLRAAPRRRVVASGLVPVGGFPIQAAGPRLLRRAATAEELERLDAQPSRPAASGSNVVGKETTAAAIAEQLATINREMRLRTDYDGPYLERLLALVEGSTGPLVRRIVHRGTDPIGCYVYVRRPGGLSRVLYLSALAAETDAVVGELVEHARSDGTAVLAGRAEPHLHEPLRRRLAVFGSAGRTLVHTRNAEVRSLLGTSSSLLTHLDGEWFAI